LFAAFEFAVSVLVGAFTGTGDLPQNQNPRAINKPKTISGRSHLKGELSS
jgi:hypothetical protein